VKVGLSADSDPKAVCNAALDRSAPGKRAGAFGAERDYTVLPEGQGISAQFCVQTRCAHAEFGINSQELVRLKKNR
jgi:hypothetical protein